MHDDGSVEVLVNLEEGERLYCVEGSREILIERSAAVAKRAMIKGRIKKDAVAGGLHIYCLGASLAVGEDRMPEIVEAINSVMEDKPYIGIFHWRGTRVFRGLWIFSWQSDEFNGHFRRVTILVFIIAPGGI